MIRESRAGHASSSPAPWVGESIGVNADSVIGSEGVDNLINPAADPDPGNNNPFQEIMYARDTPAAKVTDLNNARSLGTMHNVNSVPADQPATLINIIDNFSLYLAVATRDTSLNANNVYTQRVKGQWSFNGTGTIGGNDATWTGIAATPGNAGFGNFTDSNFVVVRDGKTVPVTDSTVVAADVTANQRFTAIYSTPTH